MNSFFQLFLVWGVLLVFLLVLYVIDKVNVIYQGYSRTEVPATYDDGLFGELAGKTLWGRHERYSIARRGRQACVRLETALRTHLAPAH
jgi:hypothetical protein